MLVAVVGDLPIVIGLGFGLGLCGGLRDDDGSESIYMHIISITRIKT